MKTKNNKKKIYVNFCLNCGRRLKPDPESLNYITKKWDGHTYKCDCMGELKVSIG